LRGNCIESTIDFLLSGADSLSIILYKTTFLYNYVG
jgi:hypothetical protein